MRLGDAALQAGDFAGAAARYEQFLEAWPASERRAEAGYLLAYSRYRQGRYADAAAAAARFAGQPGAYRPGPRRACASRSSSAKAGWATPLPRPTD